MKHSTLTSVFGLAVLAALTLDHTANAQDPHHPDVGAAVQPAAPQGQPPAAGMPMMNMMRDMPMMGMMRMMGMMGAGMSGMETIDHVEGRIAFLRTELKITDAQANVWNAFAEALRANARKLGDVRTSIMGPSAGQQQAPTMADRLAWQEQWLVARLEGTRAIKAAFTNLYGALSDDQKKTANELLAPHMGMGMMTMMPGQMQPGQMQPGQMPPGQTPMRQGPMPRPQ